MFGEVDINKCFGAAFQAVFRNFPGGQPLLSGARTRGKNLEFHLGRLRLGTKKDFSLGGMVKHGKGCPGGWWSHHGTSNQNKPMGHFVMVFVGMVMFGLGLDLIISNVFPTFIIP